ncbi:uncharacterized protein J3D65DRAFT_614325 [Phyllosticta citribraziliensis]|uniref:Uncharacterized protein n=1 Tax=Phyllosticta citribraziliensis TaxID=989973 RepID=A0ABR1M4T3_9PEZI
MPQHNQQPHHVRHLPAEADRLQDTVSAAVHAARAASSRSTPTPASAATRPRPSDDKTSTFAQRHADFRSFAPHQQHRQRPAASGSASGSSSLKKFLAEFKETYRAAPENDTAVLSREVREWYRDRKEGKKENVAAQVRAHVQLQQQQEEEAQRLLRVQEEQYRQQQELLQHQQRLVIEKQASVAPRIEVTEAPDEEDWRSGRAAPSPPEQFFDFVVRERATESSKSTASDAGVTVSTDAAKYHSPPEELRPCTQGYRQDDDLDRPSEHGAAVCNKTDYKIRAAPRAGRLLYASERICYGPNEQPPQRPAQPDDLEVLKSKIQDIKTDIMEGRQRHKAAKAARRLAESENKETEAREKWRREMKTRIGGPVLLVAGEERIGISGGARQSLDELSPVRSPVSPLRRHSSPAVSPVVARPFAPPGHVLIVPQVIPSPVDSNRRSSPPALYATHAARFTQWDDFVNPRPTPPTPPVLPPAPPGTASSSIINTTRTTQSTTRQAPSVWTPPASSKSTFSSTSMTSSKAAFASIAFKPTLPKLFTRGIHLPRHHHASSASSGSHSGASSFGCRGISAGAEANGVAAMMLRAARASVVQQQEQRRESPRAKKDGGFRSPLSPIQRVSPLAVEFGGERNSSSSSVSDIEADEDLERTQSRYSVMAAVPSPLNVRKTATTPLVERRVPRHDYDHHHQHHHHGEERYDSMLSPSSPSHNRGGHNDTSRAVSTFSRPSWWTWESSASISPESSPSLPHHNNNNNNSNSTLSQKQAKACDSDSDSESLYTAPPPPRQRADNGEEPRQQSYIPPRANWTTDSLKTSIDPSTIASSSSASTSSTYPTSNSSIGSGSDATGGATAQGVKEKTRFWDDVRRGLRPSNASFARR